MATNAAMEVARLKEASALLLLPSKLVSGSVRVVPRGAPTDPASLSVISSLEGALASSGRGDLAIGVKTLGTELSSFDGEGEGTELAKADATMATKKKLKIRI